MICSNCYKAGEENKANHIKRAAKWHEKCDYKGCICQHKTGRGWVKVPGERIPLMQIQSP